LRNGLYAGEPDLVLEVAPFTGGMGDAEIEDLLPPDLIISQLDRWQRAAPVPFADEYKKGRSIVPQIEAWGARNGVTLARPGWKVEFAKRVKQHLLKEGHEKIEKAVLDQWEKLFDALQKARSAADAPVV